jgi:UDP-N-acetylglucosamine/UDP-N-acetylgalactosamine diphosphorylase
MDQFSTIKKTLADHNQSHLLAFWNELTETDRANLLKQISELDFSELDGWVKNYVKNPNCCPIPKNFGPAEYFPAVPRESDKEYYQKAKQLGVKLLTEGKVAAFVVAGGQGTRLGFDGPKGNFPISPIKNKTLF